jgi:uncharacterized membrane protein YdbT with pleckstrin-like domain
MNPQVPPTDPNAPSGTPLPPQSPAPQEQPVAYDREGRPLYLHPSQQAQQVPQMVYMTRPLEPQTPHIPEEVAQRHADSCKKYPSLNLSEGEYVITAVRRHPIGLLRIWILIGVLMAAFAAMAAMFFVGDNSGSAMFGNMEDLPSLIWGSLGVLFVLLILGGLAATYVYESNRFFLTNESVIQEIQTSLFDKHEQTVSLSNIEDASYKQKSFIQSMFNYGTIRLSTEGDETTYTFDHVASPKRHIATLNNAVESFKNGRPVVND